jgi:hypothetical protein
MVAIGVMSAAAPAAYSVTGLPSGLPVLLVTYTFPYWFRATSVGLSMFVLSPLMVAMS